MSISAKLLAAAIAFAGLAGLLVIVDLALSAGRIHPRVSVGGVDVGGLTLREAEAVLSRRGDEIKQEPLVLTTEGLTYPLLPGDVGWAPRPFDTAQDAMGVGRDQALFPAFRQRLRAWISGVEVGWAGSTSSGSLRAVMVDVEERLAGLCLGLDRRALERRIEREIEESPREPVELPVRKLDPRDC